jgi:triosephosphate isomerase
MENFENLTDQEIVRRQKVEKLKELGIDPFGQAYDRTDWSLDIRNKVAGLTAEEVEKVIVAYEPIWAIGTGKTATKEDANDAVKQIREKIAEKYGQNTANGVIIQYGGSVKASNAKELFEMSDIDGGLVGGASLKVEEFSNIVNYNK